MSRRFFKTALIALAAVLVSTPMALADDWSGPYAGAYYGFDIGGIGSNTVGVQLGYNWDNGALVYGSELDVQSALNGSGSLLGFSGRLGTEVADSVLLYGALGVTHVNATGNNFVTLGAGAQFGVNEAVSIRIEVEHYRQISGAITGTQGLLGVVYGF
jgi:opacity protein-like surface antigen